MLQVRNPSKSSSFLALDCNEEMGGGGGGGVCREDYGMRLFHQFFGLLALSFTTLSFKLGRTLGLIMTNLM